ncbi:MAG: NADH:ubiquinone oxidoreductase subunit NDUFA12 [Rhodomicrobiaceae bacterium]
MGLFSDIFTWWNGSTLSTRLYTKGNGRFIGEDTAGNRYYEDMKGLGPADRPRRWVIYNGEADASKVPPEWHGWLHYIVDEPGNAAYQAKSWQKPHVPNMTGTSAAYRPAGSILNPTRRRPAAPDYEPWQADS